MSGLRKEEITANAIAFAQRLSRHRYETIIYTNAYWAGEVYDMEKLSDLPVWLAQYDVEVPEFEHPFCIWQYSDAGEIAGIEGPVDLNIMFTAKEN
jgi:GH25 family lysozyme M1 (1,4-beta-N-acetylmuramidase)